MERKTINKCQLDDTGAKVEIERKVSIPRPGLMTMRRASDASTRYEDTT